ncbi:MAG: signal recognition particle-docking protein FtsY [Alphaproteobacteria bacterium]|nr:MAG: signal recognition particle-docking protein FtsY [Alphaproteobacteria bacterium]
MDRQKEAATEGGSGWWTRLKRGLKKTAGRLSGGIADIFARRKLDQQALDELEELLIMADLGVETAAELVAALRRRRFDGEVTDRAVREALAEEITRLLEPVARPLLIPEEPRPYVILVAGVNGSGKTTTIAKFAQVFRDQGLKVMLAAADTFRAAAVEQLQTWGERLGVPVVAGPPRADAAAVAHDALARARREGADVLLVDTAGRLQNREELMAELAKIVRVLGRQMPGAPHARLLVLDATVGQNGLEQVRLFGETVELTGLVMTKLDGTAKGGVLIAAARRFGLPIHAIGVGEGAEDLRPFKARQFARALVGLEEE